MPNNNKEGPGDEAVECPHCGQLVDEFIIYGNCKAPSCPQCDHLVSPDGIPEAMITHRETHKEASREVAEDMSDEVDVNEMEDDELVRNMGEKGVHIVMWRKLRKTLSEVAGVGEKTINSVKAFWDMHEKYRKRQRDLHELLDEETNLSGRRIADIVENVFGIRETYSDYLDKKEVFGYGNSKGGGGKYARYYGTDSGGGDSDLSQYPPEIRDILEEHRERKRKKEVKRKREELGIPQLEKKVDRLVSALRDKGGGGDGGGGGNGNKQKQQKLFEDALKYRMIEENSGQFGGGGDPTEKLIEEGSSVIKELKPVIGQAFPGLVNLLQSSNRTLQATLLKRMGIDPSEVLPDMEGASWEDVEEAFSSQEPPKREEEGGDDSDEDVREMME